MDRRTIAILLATLASISVLVAWTPQGSGQTPKVYVLEVTGTISSITVETVNEAIATASSTSSPLILAIDTPGGTLDATFKIIEAIEGSRIPIIGYVTPAGAQAWSAGTFILLSTHVAVMAPRTIIGSAQPVVIDPSGGSVPVTDTKTINALVEFIEVRARQHSRNETAAREFITSNLNLNADEAIEFHVIEYIASDTADLLVQVDRHQTASGQYELRTAGAEIVTISPSVRILILRFLANPAIASLLLFIGLYWLIFGVNSPGHGSEVGGAILLIAGLIGLSILEVNPGALVLIAIGAALLIAELYSPGLGALGIGGFIAVVLGSLLLFSTTPLVLGQDALTQLLLILLIAPIVFGAFFLFAAYKIIEIRRKKPVEWSVVGELAEAYEDLAQGVEGFVTYQGELWRAVPTSTVRKGGRVRIDSKDGPVLRVSPASEPPENPPAKQTTEPRTSL